MHPVTDRSRRHQLGSINGTGMCTLSVGEEGEALALREPGPFEAIQKLSLVHGFLLANEDRIGLPPAFKRSRGRCAAAGARSRDRLAPHVGDHEHHRPRDDQYDGAELQQVLKGEPDAPLHEIPRCDPVPKDQREPHSPRPSSLASSSASESAFSGQRPHFVPETHGSRDRVSFAFNVYAVDSA